MSQEKVQRYKEQKANRKEMVAKQKKKKFYTKVVTWVVCLLVVAGIAGAIGVTIRNEQKAYEATRPDYAREQMVIGDMAGILSETEEAE